MKIRNLPPKQTMEIYNKAMELRKKNGWGHKRIASELGISENTIGGWLYKGRNPFAGASYPPGRLNLPDLNPSAELSYVLGAYYGDGTTYRGEWRYQILLKVKDKDFVDEFNRCISTVLHKENGYSICRTIKREYEVSASSRMLYEFLRKPLKEHKPFIEKFPAEFLRGLYDSDGGACTSRCTRGYSRMVFLASTNLTLLRYARDLLKRHFSITIKHISIGRRRGVIQTRKGQVIRATKNCYQFVIGRHEDRSKYYKHIGFSIARKQRKLAEMIKTMELKKIVEEGVHEGRNTQA